MLAVVGLLVVQLVVASPTEDVEGLRRSLRACGEGEPEPRVGEPLGEAAPRVGEPRGDALGEAW